MKRVNIGAPEKRCEQPCKLLLRLPNAKPPRYDDAEESYLKAAKLNPKEARAYLGLGFIYAAQNQVENTITAFKKAIEIKPKFADAHFNLGMVFAAIGKKEEANAEYE